MTLKGYHHLIAICRDPRASRDFLTRVLGLRLVKRAVNEDSGGWHLIFGDGIGTPGATVSLFHWISRSEQRGTNSIPRVGLRVPPDSLDYWARRLNLAGHTATAGMVGDLPALTFENAEALRFALVADAEGPAGAPNSGSDVPPRHQIMGLGAVALSVHDAEETAWFLTTLLGMRRAGEWPGPGADQRLIAFQMPDAPPGPAGLLHVLLQPGLPPARQGPGGVHHLAFQTDTAAMGLAFRERLGRYGVQVAPQIDRRYFKSIYFREPGGNLLEIASRGPGFAVDEPVEHLGRDLKLPDRMIAEKDLVLAGLPAID